jgi:GT2 family glycosyltransferase
MSWDVSVGKPRDLVSIVIVNYNGAEFLPACLRSVFGQRYRPFEVIVVDNCSTDASKNIIRRDFRDVLLVENTGNEGFAGGANSGVARTSGDLVVLLNNDTVVEEDWLDALVDAVSPDDVAIASSLVLTEGIPERYYEKNGSVNFLGHNIMRRFERQENIFYGGGASLIYKKGLLGTPFDETYFAYGEDVYLGLRARFKGYRIVHTNASVVHHKGGLTSQRQRRAWRTMLQERNRLLNTFLFFSVPTLLKVSPMIISGLVAKFIASLTRGHYSFGGLLRAYSWLLTHREWIRQKRGELQHDFKVPEKDVISWMTSWVTNGESAGGAFVNAIATAYCKLVGLDTIESLPHGTR